MCCLKKRAIPFEGEARNVSPDSETQNETTTSIPETQQIPNQILGIEGKSGNPFLNFLISDNYRRDESAAFWFHFFHIIIYFHS